MNSLSIIRIATLTLFLGRGWLYFIWSAPLRTILWSETYMKYIVEDIFGVNWNVYVTSPVVDKVINLITTGIGVVFLILFGLTFFLTKQHQKLSKFLLLGAGLMFFIILLLFIDKFFYIGMLIEHALQIGTPILLYFALRSSIKPKKFLMLAKSMIALTFVGHALFAIGFHPVPGGFIDMTISILGVSEDTAVELLLVAGCIDIVASILLFVKETEKYALFFMIFWGSATAFARVLANFNVELAYASTLQWVPEMIYRFPHALIPLALYFYLREQKREEMLS